MVPGKMAEARVGPRTCAARRAGPTPRCSRGEKGRNVVPTASERSRGGGLQLARSFNLHSTFGRRECGWTKAACVFSFRGTVVPPAAPVHWSEIAQEKGKKPAAGN